MKVRVIAPPEPTKPYFDQRQYLTIEVNGKQEFSVGEGEPEDMTMGRDLSDCYSIPNMLKAAFDAGRDPEEMFELEYVTGEDD